MDPKILSALKKCPLFLDLDEAGIRQGLTAAGYDRKVFQHGERIPLSGKGEVGILLSGKAQVFSSHQERALLNRLDEGSLFGVSSLFSTTCAETEVVAQGKVEVLILGDGAIEKLLEDARIRRNLIAFLTGRIRFLTRKIASFTSPNAGAKLARFLLENADETGLVQAFRSYSELARRLNLGRASLYRVLDDMEKSGAIKKRQKEICILSEEKVKIYLS